MTTREEQRDVARDLLSTLAEWHSTIRMWSGSAFVAGEDIGDDAGARKQLYLDLCRIGNETVWMEDQITRLRASQAGGAPAGWALVPVEPTKAMLSAWAHLFSRGSDACYVAMLSASPPPPATDGEWKWQPGQVRDLHDLKRALELRLERAQAALARCQENEPLDRNYIRGQLQEIEVAQHLVEVVMSAPATDGDALREALEPFALWATLMDKDAPDDAHLPATVPHLSLTLGQARAAADALGLVHASDDPRFNGERDIVLDALASSPPLAAADAVEAEREAWNHIDTLPPPGERPGTVWVLVEGSHLHSGMRWYRRHPGLARTHNEGFEDEDIRAIEARDHMDSGTGRVTHWLPIKLPSFPARGTDEVGNGSAAIRARGTEGAVVKDSLTTAADEVAEPQ